MRALCFALVCCLGAGLAQAGAPLAQRYAQFQQIDKARRDQQWTRAQTANVYVEAYASVARWKTEGGLSALSDADLGIYFEAADLASFYSFEPGVAGDMAVLGRALAARKLLTAPQIERTHGALFAARLAAEAAAWRADFPAAKLEAPAIGGPALAGPSVLALEGMRLQRRALELNSGKRIVAIGSGQCHFCANFLRDLARDPALQRALGPHLLWLAPQSRDTSLAALRRWNAAHPGMPLLQIYRESELPAIDSWATPSFYFMKDGRVLAKLSGWPKAGRKAELLAALKLFD